MPCGIVEAETAPWRLPCGSASKTSDGIVDAREAWGAALDATAQVPLTRVQSHRDHGPESSGRRTPCLHRLVGWCAALGKPMQRLSYPPSQSTAHPIERCWGIWAWHWNGTKWVEGETRVEWAKRMTWKGIPPIIARSRKAYQKAVTLSKKAMREVDARRERHPAWPKGDMLIHPAST